MDAAKPAVRTEDSNLVAMPEISTERSMWGLMQSQANVLVKSGMLPSSVKTAESAIAIMQTGREFGLQPMTTARMTPTTLHRVMVHDLRDALDDLYGDVPANPEDCTPAAIETLLGRLMRCETYLVMLRHNARRIERCAAVECSDASDAAASVLAQPSLRERLGRAPLGAEVLS